MRKFVYPYKKGSASAKALAEAIGAKRIKLEDSSYNQRTGHKIINWGSSNVRCDGIYNEELMINTPSAVATVSNKLTFFQSLVQPYNRGYTPYEYNYTYIPGWTESAYEAAEWLSEGETVVARHRLSGHSGEGIEILNPDDWVDESLDYEDSDEIEELSEEIPQAPLYTFYMKKKHEFRIHVAKIINEAGAEELWVFDQQRKALRPEEDFPRGNVNHQVRNHSNGFMYVRNGFNTPDKVIEAALKIFQHTALDFGAVDVIYNENADRAYVLEINTAPGLTGTTLERYATMFNTVFTLGGDNA